MKPSPARATRKPPGHHVVVVALLIVLGTACGQGETSTGDPLAGTRWEMTSVREGGVMTSANVTTIVTLVFADRTASGSTGCNQSVSFTTTLTGLELLDTDENPIAEYRFGERIRNAAAGDGWRPSRRNGRIGPLGEQDGRSPRDGNQSTDRGAAQPPPQLPNTHDTRAT